MCLVIRKGDIVGSLATKASAINSNQIFSKCCRPFFCFRCMAEYLPNLEEKLQEQVRPFFVEIEI